MIKPRTRSRSVRFYVGLVFAGVLALLLDQRLPGREISSQHESRPIVYVADVNSLIHPVTAEYIIQTIDTAEAAGATLVVLKLSTPGGLVDSTRDINSRIIESKIPVVVYVGPSGTRAASAGFLITIAADIAAMAPGTHIGAAHPVSGTGTAMDEIQAKKVASDVAAYARSLAAQRNRNVMLAEKAVTESESFTEEEALAASPPLIDLIATDLDELLEELDGRTIRRWDGSLSKLQTASATIVAIEMTWRQRVLSTIAHPQIAVLLFSLGTLGLTIELWSPGAIVPGVVGGLCLLLAFFAFQILPVNYVGLLLIFFGLVLLVLELIVTSFGILATGGIVAMVLGGLMLFDSPVPEFQLGFPFLFSTLFALAGIVLFLVNLVIRSQRRQPATGVSAMIDKVGHTITPINDSSSGQVVVHGEIWKATSKQTISKDESVRVIAVNGMTLIVERLIPLTNGGK